MATKEKPKFTQRKTDPSGEAAKAQSRLKSKQRRAAAIISLLFCVAMYFIFGTSDTEKWVQTGLN